MVLSRLERISDIRSTLCHSDDSTVYNVIENTNNFCLDAPFEEEHRAFSHLQKPHVDSPADYLDTPPNQEHPDAITALTISPDSEWVASGSQNGTIFLRNLKTVDPRAIAQKTTRSLSAAHILAFSPTSRLLASALANGLVSVWSFNYDGPPRAPVMLELEPSEFSCSAYPALAITWLPGGARIAVLTHDASLWIYNLDTDALNHVELRSDADARIAFALFHPDACLLGCGGVPSICEVRDAQTYAQVADLNRCNRQGAALISQLHTPGEHPATRSTDATARVWNIQSGERLLPVHLPDGVVRTAAHSPGGTHFLTVLDDGRMLLSELQEQLGFFTWYAVSGPDHFGAVASACFSHSGRFIASASSGGVLCLWETRGVAAGPRGVFEVPQGTAITHVAFSGDDTTLVCATSDGTVYIWPIITADSDREAQT
ncbi:hypothetical protein VTO73DRAFT_11613 [Trametes versicolor]